MRPPATGYSTAKADVLTSKIVSNHYRAALTAGLSGPGRAGRGPAENRRFAAAPPVLPGYLSCPAGDFAHDDRDLYRRPARACAPPGSPRLLRLRRQRLLPGGDLRANRADLEDIKLRQRILVDVSSRSLATTIVGQKVAAPLILAPIGLTGMQHGDGEILSAQAAEEAGIPFTLSTMSICSIEDVAAATGKPFWFQLYVIKDRGFSKDILERARGGQMRHAGAHRRPAGARPAPPRHQERHDGAAANPHPRTSSTSPASRPGPRHPEGQAQDLRQSRRPREGHGERQSAGASGPRSSSIRR